MSEQGARISRCTEAFLACLDRGHGSVLIANSELVLFREALRMRRCAFSELAGSVRYSHWSNVTQVSVL